MTQKEDRLRVQTELGVNMVVEAGAGTGKTTLLIDRLCFALLAQHISPERVVALTFTEKAAAEIKTRLIFKLQSVLIHSAAQGTDKTVDVLREHFRLSSEEMKARAEQALTLLDRAPISTIHSFCADILKAFPLDAGLTPNAEIDKGVRAARIFDTHWNRFLDRELGLNAPRAAMWKEVLARASLEEIKQAAQELCGGKIERYNYFSHKDMLAELCVLKAEEAERLSTAFLDGKSPRNIEKALTAAAQTLRCARDFLNDGVVTGPEQEKISLPSAPPKGWDEGSFEFARELLDFAAKAAPAKQDLVLKVYQLIGGVVEEIKEQYAQEGILSFDDLIIKTRNLLQSNLRVRRMLKESYDALFIDEFQDTDPAQGEILLFLAEEKTEAATSWSEVKLEKGKLFVVGDPKQSIYRFRGADITAYELFTRLILKQGGEKNYLRRNFRSESEIIETANAVIGAAMQEKETFQPAYEAIYTEKTEQTDAVELVLVLPASGRASADDYRHNQAQYIARWIRDHVGKMKLCNGKTLAYKDIALLSRASTTVWPYVDALRRNGIPFVVEEDKNFYRNQEINDFLNVLRVLDDPQDMVSLVGVLRSPLGGFTDEEIYQFSRRKELHLYADPEDERLKLFYAQLKQFHTKTGTVALTELLREIVDHTFLTEACSVAYEGEQSAANLYKLIAMAGGYALQTPVTLGQFLSQVQTLMEEELDQLSATLTDEGHDAVSVMTVHKSKGLEFPVVILADISKKDAAGGHKKTAHIYSWRHGMHGVRVGGLSDFNLAYLEEEQKKHGKCEEVRILYVALTRAREKLLLVGNYALEDKTTAALFARAGLYPAPEETAERVGTAFTLPVVYIPYTEPDDFLYKQQPAGLAAERRLDLAQWRTDYDERMERFKSLREEQAVITPSRLTEQDSDLPIGGSERAALLGSVCHKALEGLLRKQCPDLESCVRRAAQLLGADSETEREALVLLQTFIKSAVYQDIEQQEFVAAEMPFSLSLEDGRFVNGVMDLVLRGADGGIYIADYKTDHLSRGEETLAAEKYRAQLEMYRRAAQSLFQTQRVQTAVVFLRTGAAAEIA